MENQPTNDQPSPEQTQSEVTEAVLPLPDPEKTGPSKLQKARDWYWGRKRWTIPATILLVLFIIAAVPITRYKTVGLVIKRDFSLRIIDSTTKSPVSEARVSVGGISTTTDENGFAKLKSLPVGNQSLTVNKKYYKDQNVSFLVPIGSQKDVPTVDLVATGRQVKVQVKNYVSKKPLSKVNIRVSGIEATTDKDGMALLVLPADVESQSAELSLDGFNKASVKIAVYGPAEMKNSFELVPSGKIYFMSKRTGKLNLMSSNIDGSDAKVVVSGTGTEQDYRTSLVISPSLEYAALLTKRNSSDPTPQLYIVGKDGKLLNVDGGNTEIYIHGWSAGNLIYGLSRNDLPDWQAGKHKLKSYNAASGRTTLLDQSAGSDETSGIGEYYSMVAVSGNSVVYAKSWSGYFSDPALAGKQDTFHSIGSGGQNHKQITSFDSQKYSIQYRQHSPGSFYIQQTGPDNAVSYMDFSLGGLPKSINLDADKFYDSYPEYFVAPSGDTIAWSDLRDGKDVILVGNYDGGDEKSVAALNEFSIYGWFGNGYLLLSKKGSELYIMAKDGGDPVKITDYQSVNGTYRYF